MHSRLPGFFLVSAAMVVGFAHAAAPVSRPKALYGEIAPICAPEALRQTKLPNTTIETVTVDPALNACLITATVTHPPARDHVKVHVALPLKGWNGRFRGNGGGGYVGGNVGSLRGPVLQGYATAVTDTGHEGGEATFALDNAGRLNWQEVRNFAHLGIHDMTLVGQALTRAFYGRPARYSYFVGSSTGGRQGMMEAQRYPEDYDGILSGCPAINWHRFLAAGLWPQVLMQETGNFVSKAKLDAATAAAVRACDAADGVVDGIIDDPSACRYDPQGLVGTMIDGSPFTAADAELVRRCWEGPRSATGKFMWYGYTPGTDLNAYAGTAGTPLVGKPFPIALDWFRYFVLHDPQWDWTKAGRDGFELLWNQSVDQFATVIGTDDPNLARFRDRGGKVIITHGLADQLVPSGGTVEYYQRLQREMGGASATAEFARLFLVPGANHGLRGAPAPSATTLMNAILRWVEEGQAPERLPGEQRDESGKLVRTRPVFPFPDRAVYKGTGSTDEEANFERRPPARS